MRVEVFDDWQSIGHFLLGVASFFIPLLFFVFLAYELIEFCIKGGRGRERAENFVGDLLEFALGAGLAAIALGLL